MKLEQFLFRAVEDIHEAINTCKEKGYTAELTEKIEFDLSVLVYNDNGNASIEIITEDNKSVVQDPSRLQLTLSLSNYQHGQKI